MNALADHTVFLNELLSMSDLRTRSYTVTERPLGGLAALDVSARSGGDWYFARTWIPIHHGRTALYGALDRVEAAGFRFRIQSHAATDTFPHQSEAPRSPTAKQSWAQLTPREQEIHRELFPDEARLLATGYDWDARHIYHDGVALRPDAAGRILEHDADIEYEWVPVPSEHTWRRYPLRRLSPATIRCAEGGA